MGKYASWNEFEKNVPITYQERATPQAYRTGMQGIAPTGLKVKEGRVEHYGSGVDGKGVIVVAGYKRRYVRVAAYRFDAYPNEGTALIGLTAVAAAVREIPRISIEA